MSHFIPTGRLLRWVRPSLIAFPVICRTGVALSAAAIMVASVGPMAHGAEPDEVPALQPLQDEDSPQGEGSDGGGIGPDWQDDLHRWAGRFEEPEEMDEEESELRDTIAAEMFDAVLSSMGEAVKIQEECAKKGLKPDSEEVMQKTMEAVAPSIVAAFQKVDPEIQKLHAKKSANARAWLQPLLGMDGAEFEAVSPMLERVRMLRGQYQLAEQLGGQQSGQPGMDMFQQFMSFDKFCRLVLGDQSVDPSVSACVDGRRALHAMIGDKQASPNEVAAAVARLREAKKRFQMVLDKAEAELRAVLTPRQQGLLVQEGLLD